MTELSELLLKAKGDRSVDQLIAEAERHGSEINHTARSGIYKALKGEHAKSPRDSSLRLWARVFGLDVTRVREAADRPAGELGPWTPVEEAAQLDRDQRIALDQLIKTIVRGGVARGGTIATSKEPGEDPDNVYDFDDYEAARDVGNTTRRPRGEMD